MNKLLEFAAANPYLVTATVLMLIAVVAFELRLRARAGFEVSVAEAVRMINNGATVVDVRDAARFGTGTPCRVIKHACYNQSAPMQKHRGGLIFWRQHAVETNSRPRLPGSQWTSTAGRGFRYIP